MSHDSEDKESCKHTPKGEPQFSEAGLDRLLGVIREKIRSKDSELFKGWGKRRRVYR